MTKIKSVKISILDMLLCKIGLQRIETQPRPLMRALVDGKRVNLSVY